MRIVALIAVGMAVIAGAFALGRGTRADADGPAPRAAAPTPAPLEPGAPVSASGIAPAQTLPALRPAPRKPSKT